MSHSKLQLRTPQRAFLLAAALTLFAAGIALANGSIDTINKWAWGTNAGWISLNDTNGSTTVFSDHLEGYAWGENVGWVRMGTATGGSPHTYANDANTTYGVNNDGVGNLSGYAWGTNIGWINFNPSDGQVWIDPVTGDFNGYAWSENVGWINFNGTAGDTTPYKTQANWHGDLLPAYKNGIAAIITTHRSGPASSAGLTIGNSAFLNQAGDGIIFGHNNAAFGCCETANLGSSGADERWARIWQLDVNDENANGGTVTLTFDISDAGGTAGVADFDAGGTYFLLKRAAGSSNDFTDVTVISWSVSGDSITFTVDAAELGSEFTVGAVSSPTAVSPTVTITTSDLARSNDVPSCTYNLYHSLLPYSSFGVLVADMGTTPYNMSSDIGGAPDFYYVGVDCGAGGTAVSATVGEFSFAIVPGSP